MRNISNFRPIDSLSRLKGLSLDILLHFQENDEVLSNRGDHLHIQRLKTIQSKTDVLVSDDGGHMSPHLSLWKIYFEKINRLHLE
ncbi:MAG: hypothetical protein Tsb0021_01580 [Chlamydiales bacterium]